MSSTTHWHKQSGDAVVRYECRRHIKWERQTSRHSTSSAALACAAATDPAELGRRTPAYMSGPVVWDTSGGVTTIVLPPGQCRGVTIRPEQPETDEELRERVLRKVYTPELRSQVTEASGQRLDKIAYHFGLDRTAPLLTINGEPADEALTRMVLGSEYVDAVDEGKRDDGPHGVYEFKGVGERVEHDPCADALARHVLGNAGWMVERKPEPPKPAQKRRLRFWLDKSGIAPVDCDVECREIHDGNWRTLMTAAPDVTELPKPARVEVGQWWQYRRYACDTGPARVGGVVGGYDGTRVTLGNGSEWHPLVSAMAEDDGWHYLGDAEPVMLDDDGRRG
jgi:hypothetical protein